MSTREFREAPRDDVSTRELGDEVFALVPDEHGVAVVDVRQLAERLDDEALYDAIGNAAIHEVWPLVYCACGWRGATGDVENYRRFEFGGVVKGGES